MHNQCVVLLVSYFTSSLKEIFVKSTNGLYGKIDPELLTDSDLKFKLSELLKYDFNLNGRLGQILIDKQNISFQDMKSTLSAFKKYFGLDIERNSTVDNIITGQASRHCIVHSAEIIDEKFLHQIRNCNHRKLLLSPKINKKVEWSMSELYILSDSLIQFLDNLTKKISAI